MQKVYRKAYKEPKLCDFNKIELRISSSDRVKLIKLAYKKSYLNRDERVFATTWLWKAESVINKARHLISLADKALLKAGGGRNVA